MAPTIAAPRPRLAVVAFAAAIMVVCVFAVAHAPKQILTVANVAAPKMPELVSAHSLFGLRCFMLLVNLWAHAAKARKKETKVVVHKPESALQAKVPISIRGGMWLSFFTVQQWLLQTVYLTGACTCSASALGLALPSSALPTWLPTALWMAYEVSFSTAILTSAVVKYILSPESLAN